MAKQPAVRFLHNDTSFEVGVITDPVVKNLASYNKI